MKKFLLLLTAFAFMNCAVTEPFNVPREIKPSSKAVFAETTHFNPLFLFPQFKTAETIENMKGKCAGKEVTGITVEISRRFILGVLVTIRANGYCAE